MLDIGGWEFLVVAFVLLMVVGPKELPKMLRGLTRGVRHVRSMASEFTRSMEELATDDELGDFKSTIAGVKSGDLSRIADAIDPAGDLKDSIAGIESNTDLESASAELSSLKDIGTDTSKQINIATAPLPDLQKSDLIDKAVKKQKS
jgi:sec-independent protein translocase protein TatB